MVGEEEKKQKHRGSSEEGKKNKRVGKRDGCRWFVKQKLNKMQHAGKDNKHKKNKFKETSVKQKCCSWQLKINTQNPNP